MVLMKILVIALLASVAFISGQTTRPCDLKIGSIGGSPGGQYQLAQKLGWVLPTEFNLCVTNVPGSLELYDAMSVGTYDLTVAQLDNALSRYVNGILPLVVLGGDSRGGGQGIVGNLNNGIHTVADLRGKNIGVDAVESGLVYGLRKVLAVHGLLYPRDYNFVVCGGTPQRTTCTQQGFVMINGQKVLVHASSLPTSAADPAKNTTMLAYVPDYIAPLQSTAIQVVQSTLSDATKVSALTTYMYHLIRAQKFYANPANKDYIIKEFLAKGVTTAAALATARASYDAFMNIQDGSVTATNDWTFQRVPVLNVIYVRKEFNGFTVPNADQIDFNDLITPRPGGFIDYSIRDAANALVAQNVTVTVNHQVTDSGICWNYAGGQTVTVPNFLAGLRNNGVSGGCLGTPVLTVRSITTTDNNAHISDFSYNAASDTLTFVADTSFNSNGITSRQVTVVVDVSEPCTPGVLDSITQVYTFYNKNSGPASCVSLVPPCVVQVTHTQTNSWTGQGVSHAQYNLHISNPSSTQKVTSVQFQLSAEDAANLENVWNLQVVDAANRIYTLPNWQVGIAASSSYEQAGYISKVAPLTWKVINPVCQQL